MWLVQEVVMNTNGFSLAPLFRHSVGFDRFDDLINTALRADQANGYPPYDIVRDEDGHYRIIMALAGFSQDDIQITVQDSELKITGRPPGQPDEGLTWLHRGIARRAFERTFKLADYVLVSDASLANGVLTVMLHRHVPEEKKPRTIPINSSVESTTITQ